MAEGFICSRFRRPTEPCPVAQQQQMQSPPQQKRQPSLDCESHHQLQPIGPEKRTLNIRLLSEAISSLVLLPVRILFYTFMSYFVG